MRALRVLARIGGRRIAQVDMGWTVDTRFFELLDVFREPAYVISEKGSVVYTNSVAKEQFETPPRWMQSLAKNPDSKLYKRYCVTLHLDLDGDELLLVLPRLRQEEATLSRRPSMLLGLLPPSLTQVAKWLMMGMSDKEIALCSGLTIATVRTYTGRIYRRLGVGSRQELLALALTELGFDPTPTPPPTSSQ